MSNLNFANNTGSAVKPSELLSEIYKYISYKRQDLVNDSIKIEL